MLLHTPGHGHSPLSPRSCLSNTTTFWVDCMVRLPRGNHWHQPSRILLLGGRRKDHVSGWVCCLLATNPWTSGVLGFCASKGLWLGSRRNIDETAEEWSGMGFVACQAGLDSTLAFAGYQPGPSPAFSTGHQCSESGSGCSGLQGRAVELIQPLPLATFFDFKQVMHLHWTSVFASVKWGE